MSFKRCLILIALLLLVSPVWADEPSNSGQTISTSNRHVSGGFGYQGWGVRVGVADNVDQTVGGVHFNMGEIMDNLRFQPDVQLGAGDDVTTIYGTVPVYYRFGRSNVTPYAGGGLAFGYVKIDTNFFGIPVEDSSFEVGAKATAGLEWAQKRNRAFFVELSLGIGDVHDATLVAAWTF